MTYQQWISMNLEYEDALLKKLYKKYGKTSKQYKNKLAQIEKLKGEI